MRIVITAEEAIDRGIWEDLAEMKGLNVWAVNQGQMDGDDEISLNAEEARKLGVIR